MGLARIELESGCLDRLAEYRLAIGKAAQRGRVKATERVEGIALVPAALDCGIEEPQVEGGVVSDQHRSLASGRAHGLTHRLEHLVQRLALGQCRTQGMIRVDAGDFQRFRVQVGALERLHASQDRGIEMQLPGAVHAGDRNSNFQQGIGFGMKAAGFDIHDHGQETAEAVGHPCHGLAGGHFHCRSIAVRSSSDRCRPGSGLNGSGGHASFRAPRPH
jgi:hypothetical protein